MNSSSAEYGMATGKVFPAGEAKSLLNPLRRLVQSPRRTVAVMQLATDARVLEIGSGPGFFSPYIAASVTDGYSVHFDLQAEMLAIANQRLSEHSNTTCVQGSGSVLPFADGSFDAVFVALVLGEIDDRNSALDDIGRVLRPGGAVTISETRRDSDFIPLAKLRESLERLGFEYVEHRGIRLQYTARFVWPG